MKSNWWYRFIFLIFVTTISVLMIIPTVFNFTEDSNYFIKSKINLGLDLQGGLYMVLGIDFDKVYTDELKGQIIKIKGLLLDQLEMKVQIDRANLSDKRDPKQAIILPSGGDITAAKEKIKEWYGRELRLTKDSDGILEYALTPIRKTNIEKMGVTKSIEVIRNRIDEFGVTEPEIISQGSDRILVQLPGVKDIERAKELIGQTAKLEFKIVNDVVPFSTIQGWVAKAKKSGIEYKEGMRFSKYLSELNEHAKNDLPQGFILAFQKTVNKVTNEITTMLPFLVEESSTLTGDDLQDAAVKVDQQKNQPYVSMNFKAAGAKKFEKITEDNVGKKLAVILDGNVYTAPNINEKIGGGRAQITLGTGNFNSLLKDAQDISLVLRAGALPVQLDFLEQRIVGPSLGADSIDKALRASLIGAALVFIFILFYYKISGAIALVALFLNVIFVMACLVGMEATLTLPGIAGIALTIGMAIDASIIIYERIREEMCSQVNNFKAVENGFAQAFWTIIDANITTALAGLCLLNFGTGPIKGFAVTLLIGIVATVYTAYFVSNLIFEFYMNKVSGNDLSI